MLLYLGILLLIAGVILLLSALTQLLKFRSFARDGASVMATIVDKARRKHGEYAEDSKVSDSFYFEVTYAAGGAAYQKTIWVDEATFNANPVDGQIEMKYKPKNPKRCVAAYGLKPQNHKALLIVGAVLLIAGVALCFLGRM